MFQCHLCSSEEARQELVRAVFEIDGKPLLAENIPAEGLHPMRGSRV